MFRPSTTPNRRKSAVDDLQVKVAKIQAVWRGFIVRKKGLSHIVLSSSADLQRQQFQRARENLKKKQQESKPYKLDAEEWNRFNMHAKVLYLVSLYAVEGRIGGGAWIRSLALDVMIFECVVNGALSFDYAPVSVRMSQPGGTSRQIWLNISQEGKICLDELRQKGLLIALKAMTEDLQPLTCLQVSKKGLSLLKKVPRVILQEIDDVVHRPSGHPSKRGELLQVAWDPEEAVFNLRGSLSKKVQRVSECTEPEDVSYCSSPYIPRCLWDTPKLKLNSNAKIAMKKLRGGGDAIRDDNLDEACYLSDVCVMVMEWIPFGENQMVSANERLGAVERNKSNMFTRLVDKEPTNTSFETSDTLTKVTIKDYDPVRHINFEAEIFAPMPEGVIQIENFGVNIRTDGTITFGLFIDAISSYGRDHVSLDFLSRLLVDVMNDTSIVMNDILTPYQSTIMDLTFRGDHLQRLKYSLIIARKVSPQLSAKQFLDDEDVNTELRQVVGGIMGATSLGGKNAKDTLIIARNGLICIGPSSKQHESLLFYYGALQSRELFIRSLFLRTFLLSLSLAKCRDYINRKEESPHHINMARSEFANSAKGVVLVEQILDYLNKSFESLYNPVEGLNPKNAKKGSPTRSVTKSGALQQISIPLVEALDLYDEGLAKDIKLRIKDMRKTVDGLMGTLKILRIIMGSVKVQASQTIAKGIEQNYSRLIDASKAEERSEVASMVMEVILGGSMAM